MSVNSDRRGDLLVVCELRQRRPSQRLSRHRGSDVPTAWAIGVLLLLTTTQDKLYLESGKRTDLRIAFYDSFTVLLGKKATSPNRVPGA